MKFIKSILIKVGLVKQNKPDINKIETQEDIFKNIVKSVIENDTVPHTDLQLVCRKLFNVELPTTNWAMKDAVDSGLIFTIYHVNTITVNGDLSDIILSLKLYESTSSFCIQSSVKELTEFLQPVFPPPQEALDKLTQPKSVS